MQYTWDITHLKTTSVSGVDGIVYQIFWTKTGTDENGNQGIWHGATPISSVNDFGEGFIQFEDLKEETILDWIKDQMNDTVLKSIDHEIDMQINMSQKTYLGDTLPWNKK